MQTVTRLVATIEMAAKYVCNHHCGRCPMLVVKSPCPAECNLDTVAWQCWISYFQNMADTNSTSNGTGPNRAVRHDATPATVD